MMWGLGYGGGWAAWVGWGLVHAAFWALVITGGVSWSASWRGKPDAGPPGHRLEILKQRYARGEIAEGRI